ncbi:MAG: reverse transcriptase family protein [bacterium]|nr:reverse transcriptase family protein [bacterium]
MNYEELPPEKSPKELMKEELIERALAKEELMEFDAIKPKKTSLIKPKEIPACLWLAKEIKVYPDTLIKALKLVRSNRPSYKVIYLPKENGEERQICIPDEALKRTQRRINKYILNFLIPAKNVFGFSGGSIGEAINPHLRARSILCIDFEDAFPSVTFENVFDYLIEGRAVCLDLPGPNEIAEYNHKYRYEYGYFSWYAARIIAELTTFEGKLPQGAPTSPRLFDLICKELDEKLLHLAENVEGEYTRYADNIFFSMGQKDFPNKVRNAVLRTIKEYGFGPHKIKTRRMIQGSTLKMLGLNVIEGKVHNTRSFKRRLRLSLHRIGWLLNHGMDYEEAWQKLCGQMAFARTNTLPRGLLDNYLELEKRIF